ncbi:MAG: hypothetical protein WCG23_12795 [bacterium]
MKKFFTIILSVLIFFAVNLPILAQAVNNATANEVTPDKNIIVCDSNSSNYDLCSKLIFSQKNIELKSDLMQGYKANLYKIQNNSENDIEIISIDNIENWKAAARLRIENRKQLHGSKEGEYELIIILFLVPPFILASPIFIPLGVCGLLYETTIGKLKLVIGNKQILKEAEQFREYSMPASVKKGESLSLLLLADEKKVQAKGTSALLI